MASFLPIVTGNKANSSTYSEVRLLISDWCARAPILALLALNDFGWLNMTQNFDAIVIGAGQAGPSLAGRLTASGMKVAGGMKPSCG